MTKFRRHNNTGANKQQLVRIFLILASILLFAIVLFQIDSFPSNSNNNTRRAPLLSPESLLSGQVSQQLLQHQIRQAKEFDKERVDDNSDDNKDDGVSDTSSSKKENRSDDGGGNDAARTKGRRYVMELANLVEEGVGATTTTTGKVIIEARPSWAPIGVEHFDELVTKHNFYDGCRFFRVVKNFIVQFGMNGDPEVQTKFRGQLKDDPVIASNKRGTITYATSGPNTRTTQLFINTKKDGSNAFLDEQGFAPFAVVVEGMEYVDMINNEYAQKPGQGKIRNRGNSYLNEEFPNLSYIVSIREIGPAQQNENEEGGAAALAQQ